MFDFDEEEVLEVFFKFCYSLGVLVLRVKLEFEIGVYEVVFYVENG